MKDFIDIHLNNNLFFSKRIIKPDYDICYSNLIDDCYYNFAYLKTSNVNYNQLFKNVTKDMHSINRQTALYITSDIINPELEKALLDNNFKLLYTDSWLVLDNISDYLSFKSTLDFSTHRIDKSFANTFAKIVMQGFSGENPDDPYENLSDGYIKSIEQSVYNCNNDYKILHYVGDYKEEIISTASIVYKNNAGILYDITTNKKYQKLGVCKQMMSDIINELKSLGIEKLCVQTEKDFYPEQIYQKFGFKKTMLGFAYKMEE